MTHASEHATTVAGVTGLISEVYTKALDVVTGITDPVTRFRQATDLADAMRGHADDAAAMRAEIVLTIKETPLPQDDENHTPGAHRYPRLQDVAELLGMKVSRTHQLIQQAQRRRAELTATTGEGTT